MKLTKLSLDGNKVALVNFDNVTEVHERVKGGCDIYFNTMAMSDDQAYIQVKESISEIELIVNNGDSNNE